MVDEKNLNDEEKTDEGVKPPSEVSSTEEKDIVAEEKSEAGGASLQDPPKKEEAIQEETTGPKKILEELEKENTALKSIHPAKAEITEGKEGVALISEAMERLDDLLKKIKSKGAPEQ